MNRLFRALLWGATLAFAALAAGPSRADVVFAVRVLREGGCGGVLPGAPPLHRNEVLDRSASEWAAGRALSAAIELNGYRAVSAAGLHVRGPDEAMLQLLKRSGCGTLANSGLHEMGIYHRGFDIWIVLATQHELSAEARDPGSGSQPKVPAPAEVISAPAPAAALAAAGQVPSSAAFKPASPNPARPDPALSPILSTRALQLVNNVRARGARCGSELFGPAPPLTLSVTLSGVALGHASDMAENNYFEHQDLQGKTPSDRVRASGYKEKLVGENIAYGPKTVDEVVQGWLDSPGHCENIMDPRFAEMGVGYAVSQDSKHALYWVQLFAEPRRLARS